MRLIKCPSNLKIETLKVYSIRGLLHRVDVGDISDVSEVYVAPPSDYWHFEPDDGGSMYLRNLRKMAHIHMM
jgi:hypothetical protein